MGVGSLVSVEFDDFQACLYAEKDCILEWYPP